MVSVHIQLPPLRYFVAFISVFCVILCVSVPCYMPPRGWGEMLCGWSVMPCGWGWGTLPCGWGYSQCGEIKSFCGLRGLHCGKGLALWCARDVDIVHYYVNSGRLPFCLNSSRPLFDMWDHTFSGWHEAQSTFCNICDSVVAFRFCSLV